MTTYAIQSLRASRVGSSGTTYSLELTVGTGNVGNAPSSPYYDPESRVILWDLTGYDGNESIQGTVTVDFSGYSGSQIAKIDFSNNGLRVRKGGVVIKQTDYPPNATMSQIIAANFKNLWNVMHLNDGVSNSLFLKELNLVFTDPDWNLTLTFSQSGTNYRLINDQFNFVTFNQVLSLQLLMEEDGSGSNDLVLSGPVSSAQLSASLPIVLSTSPILSGTSYHKKGGIHIA